MPCVLKRCNIPLKEAQLAFIFESSTISKKYVTLLSKKPSCHLFWKEHHLFEGKVLLTKKKIEPAAAFESYTMIWTHVTFNHTISW